MERKIILSADSTCDLGNVLKDQYGVHYYPYHIILDNQQYTDGLDITPEDLYTCLLYTSIPDHYCWYRLKISFSSQISSVISVYQRSWQ